MSKQVNTLFAESRKQEIVNSVNDNGEVIVQDLCDKFGVSPATIRNDLNELERLGMLLRTHGGAVSNAKAVGFELTSIDKENCNLAQKRAIAHASLDYIKPGAVIVIDTGTTTVEIAKALKNVPRKATVITNDLLVATTLEQNNDITVVLIGGTVRKGFHCTTGSTAIDAMNKLYIDVAFIATNGINIERGLSTPDMDMANVKRKMIEIAQKTILVADSSKIGTNALAAFGELSDIDVIITDDGADDEFVKEVEANGGSVVRVN